MELNRKNMKKIILLIIIAGLVLWVALNLETALAGINWVFSLLTPLVVGFCVAFVLNVLMRGLENHAFKPLDARCKKVWPKLRRAVSILLSILILAAVITIVILLLIPAVKDAWGILVEQFPAYWESLQAWAAGVATDAGVETLSLPDLTKDYDNIIKVVEKFFTTGFAPGGGFTSAIGSAVGIMSSLVSVLVNAILGFVLAIYMLAGKEKLANQATRIVRAYVPEKGAEEIFYIGGEANRIFSNFIVGQVTDATILGCLCALAMLIFRMPYAGMIAVLIGFTALIPIFGAFIGTAIGAFLILMNDPMQAFWFVIMIIVLQQIDGKLIYPRVVGSSVGLPPLWTLLAVLVGGSIGGLLGMLVGVPTAALLYALIRRSVNRRTC